MCNETILNIDFLQSIKAPDRKRVDRELSKELKDFKRKIVVLDDDPTGTQTVHGISVFTEWSVDSIKEGFMEENSMFYILTNSRGMTRGKTEKVHKEIAGNIKKVSMETGKSFCIISRSDSTLRGHYPLETEVLRKEIEGSGKTIDGEILAPYFLAGGRLTINNIHYVREGDKLIPAAQTEFANDKSFGYSNSHMGRWCEEKTGGAFKAENITYISLEEIRKCDYKGISEKLMNVKDFNKVVVNAAADEDMKVFTTAMLRAYGKGKEFLFRTAAGFPQMLGGIKERPLLSRTELVSPENSNGGIVLIGSHVQKTTRQLNVLLDGDLPIDSIEFNSHRVIEEGGLEDEVNKVLKKAESLIRSGRNTVIYTRRERFDLDTDDRDAQLEVSLRISDAVTSIIGRLTVRPNFIIAKGGITSSDVATRALRVKRADVMGQILPGIPVWKTGSESKFPALPYVIFPGNVGRDEALKNAVAILSSL